MAGIMFTDGQTMLVGYKQKTNKITGIGGKSYRIELVTKTAVRETLEELFEFEELPKQLVQMVHSELVFDKAICYGDYTTFVMTFVDLHKIFEIMMLFELKSKVYDTIPTGLCTLITRRKLIPEAELSYLMLLPCIENIELDRYLLSDIYRFKNL